MGFKHIAFGTLATALLLSTSGMARTNTPVAESLRMTSARAATHSRPAANDAATFKSKVKKVVEENDFSDLKGKKLTKDDMKGAALSYFKEMNKTWGPDYPPAAKLIDVDGQKAILIRTETDGGSYVGVFYPSGQLIAKGAAGESEGLSWEN